MILKCSLESGPLLAHARRSLLLWNCIGIGLPQFSAHTQSGAAIKLHE